MGCPSKKCNPLAGYRPEDELDPQVCLKVKERMKDMVLTNDILRKEMQIYLENVERGIKKETNPTAIIKCFPTFVQDLPNGTEKGKFLALDLGGTNFRVLIVELDVGKCEMQSDVYVIPADILVGTGAALFDFIAECLAKFANAHGVQNDNLPLGFTFSFPVTQVGLNAGILRRWTKGFKCDDVVGEDAVKWLIDAINRRNDVKIDVCAILNDTTGTLMACAWKNPACRIGLIVGTGSNACYVEKQKNVTTYTDPDMGSGNIILNLEMGAFGEDGSIDFLRTEEDKIVDENTLNRGTQIHEKLVAGMYLGEIVRLRTLNLIKDGLIFKGCDHKGLQEIYAFTTEMISEIESERVGTYDKMNTFFKELGIQGATTQDMINFRYICQVVARRSAHLIAASLVQLIQKMGEPYVVVGIDGSVYKHHPFFRRIMTEKMKELIAPGFKFELMLSEDGSGRGAALVAAVAARKKREMGG